MIYLYVWYALVRKSVWRIKTLGESISPLASGRSEPRHHILVQHHPVLPPFVRHPFSAAVAHPGVCGAMGDKKRKLKEENKLNIRTKF